jgi:hypothetical protein
LEELKDEKKKIYAEIKEYVKKHQQVAEYIKLEKLEREIKSRIKKEVNDPAKEAGLEPIIKFKGGPKLMIGDDDDDDDDDDDNNDDDE